MARIGSAIALWFLVASPAWAEVEFHMVSDRTKVGLEDTFRVDIAVSNAPEGAVVQFPVSKDFEVLSRSESTQMSYSVGTGGAGVISQLRKYTLVVRPLRVGALTIPPPTLQTTTRTYTTAPLSIEVVKGKLAPDAPPTRRAPPNPFGLPPGFGFFGDEADDDPFGDALPRQPGPRGDSDIFLRATVDKNDVFVNEQVIMSLLLYSQANLSSVDGVSMPKYEGFWTNELKTSGSLSPERRDVDGIPYSVYVLRRKVLFPMRAGTLTIEPAEAELTSGALWSSHRIHRKSNALTVKARPLPAGGRTSAVGQWRLSAQLSNTEVALGDPVQLKVTLQGRGNLEGVQVPPLEVPASIRVFDPETRDRSELVRGSFTGLRTLDYVLVAQQTGTFTIPGVTFPFFNPETRQYEDAKTDPLTLTVTPSASGARNVAVPGGTSGAPDATQEKNKLVNSGLKPLRHSAHFTSRPRPAWSQPYFWPLLLAPPTLLLLWAGVGLLASSLRHETAASRKAKQARAARKRLRAAERLLAKGAPTDFYAEVDRALRSFLEAKLGVSISGLTREQLDALLEEHKINAPEKARLATIFETCDLGRYAPGMGEPSARQKAIAEAAAAMEAWS